MEYFRDEMKLAQERQNLSLREDTQFYVVNLLSEFRDARKLFDASGEEPADEAIALKYARALQAQGQNEKFALLKNIGDRTLYLSGFFSDSFRRKVVDIDYYIAMGEQAYSFAHGISKDQARGAMMADVFGELANKFTKLVGVLSEISEKSGITSDADLLRLYERWMITKSDRLQERLRQEGILAVPCDRDNLH